MSEGFLCRSDPHILQQTRLLLLCCQTAWEAEVKHPWIRSTAKDAWRKSISCKATFILGSKEAQSKEKRLI